MLINIIFISKQTKIADFHTLYIMRCRHPKETATLKKKKKETPPRPPPSPIAISAQGNSNQLSHQASEQIPFGPPLEKAGRHRRSPPLHKLSNATSFAGKRDTFTVSPLAQGAQRQLPQRNAAIQTASRHPNLGQPPDSKPP